MNDWTNVLAGRTVRLKANTVGVKDAAKQETAEILCALPSYGPGAVKLKTPVAGTCYWNLDTMDFVDTK